MNDFGQHVTEPFHRHEHSHSHDQQPSAYMCFICGVRNVAGLQVRFFNDGLLGCMARVTLDEHYQGFPGIAHGGIVAALLDEALGRSVMAQDPNRFMYTAKIEVRYRQPTPLHEMLVLRAQVEKDRQRLAFCVAQLTNEDGSVIYADANGTMVSIPQHIIDATDIEEVGWKIVP